MRNERPLREIRRLSAFVLMACLSLCAFAQKLTVKGRVVDAANEAIIGASVQVKGTANGSITDMDGNFTLQADPGATLVVSYIGYQTREVKAASTVNVTLSEDNELLDEVVVIGYGSVKRRDVTTAVSTVSTDDIQNRPILSAAQAMQGKAAGVSVIQPTGQPGGDLNIRVRGTTSFNGSNDPLYVVDGVPVDNIKFLSPNDIASMQILKDASSAAIYGSRAANGVIYVTTKKGSRGKQQASFRFSGSYGVSTPVNNNFDLMDGYDLLAWQTYFGEISQSTADNYRALLDRYGATDWFRYIYRTAPTYSAEFSVNGGSEKVGYYVSGSYMNQEGMAPNSGMERYTFRTNLSAEATSWLRINMNLAASVNATQTTQSSSSNGVLNLTSVTNFPIYMPTYMTRQYINEEGNPENYLLFPNQLIDPYYVMEKAPATYHNHLLNGNISLVITPIEGLTITSMNGIDGTYSTYDATNLPSHLYTGGIGARSRAFNQQYTLTTSNTVEYKFKPIKEMHNITLLVGQEGIDYYSDMFQAVTQGQVDDRLYLLSQGTQTDMTMVTEGNGSYNMLSFFGRVNYEYGRKYAVDVTIRNDASSKFGRDNRDAFFYAVGGMWNLKEETSSSTTEY